MTTPPFAVKPPFDFLNHQGTLPPMLAVGLSLLGTHEAPGPANNKTILDWAKEVDVADVYKADSTAWCGLFMRLCAVRAHASLACFQHPRDSLWALNWAHFGVKVGKPCLGDVLTFTRPGGGHVTQYVAEDASHYYCLGGNQSDMVCIEPIAKYRLNSASRMITNPPLACVKPFVIKSTGQIASTNEA